MSESLTNGQIKVKLTSMTEDGDKLEFEAVLSKGASYDEAVRRAKERFSVALKQTAGAGASPQTFDKVKVEAFGA